MAGRNTIFYYQWQNRDNKRFYRLEMIPADIDSGNALVALSSPDVVQLPSECILREDGRLSASFESGLPLGLPLESKMSVTFALQYLESSTDLINFRDYLLQPKSAYQWADDLGNLLYTSNTWTLFDKGTDGNQDFVVFQGVQSIPPERVHSANKKTGEHYYKAEIRHIVDAVVREVTPAMICDHILHVGTASYPSPHNTANHPIGAKNMYELIYRDDVTLLAYGMADTTYANPKDYHDANEPDLDLVRLWRLMDIYMAIQNRANRIYAAYLRRTLGSEWRYRLRSDSEDATDYGGMPYDNVRLFKQAYTPTGERGYLLDRDEICFIGQIWNESDTEPGTTGVSETDYTDYIGGFLVSNDGGNKDESLYQYDSMWDFLQDTTQLCFSKGGYSVSYSSDASHNDYTCNLHFLKLYSQVQQSTVSITTQQMFASEVTLAEGRSAIRVSTPDPAGFGPGDRTDDVKFSEAKTREQPEWAVTAPLHNVAIVGDDISNYSNRFWLYNGNSDLPTTRGDFDNDKFVIFARTGFRQSLLWYYEVPGIPEDSGTNKIPLLLHPQVGINDGLSIYYDGGVINDWPVSGNQQRDSETGKDRNILFPVLGRLLTLQGSSGLPFSTARRIVRTFGSDTQLVQEGIGVPIEALDIRHLGANVSITGASDASIYLRSGTYLSHLNAGGFATKIEMEVFGANSAITMLALGQGYPRS